MALKIVVDVMGADRPPGDLVRGALSAAARLPIHLVFVGQRQLIEPWIAKDAPAEIVDAPAFVPPDAPPVRAARDRNTSIVRGLELLADGKAKALLSPGNTGAVVAASLLVLGRLPGVKRPGICASLPTLKGRELLLIDAGATADPRPEHLVQFAEMGTLYAREVLNFPQPRVGLLSIGSEPLKGDKLVRNAYTLLRARSDFAGNVEPHELLPHRPVDVVVAGGFAGNLTIKALEGGVEAGWLTLRSALSGGVRNRLGGLLLRPALQALARQMSYDRYNGAPLLGVQGLVMIAHGRSSPQAMEAAVEKTYWAAKVGVVEGIAAALSR
jgi:glycerol-3-phosphate acyltransferase PlsX